MRILKELIKMFLLTIMWLSLVSITIIMAFFSYTSWLAYQPLITDKFNSEQWKTAETDRDKSGYHPFKRRCGMYHDLTRNYLKKNMTIKEVEDLLGPTNLWRYCKNQKIKCAYYSMGICYSNVLSIVPMDLFPCFNRKGKLVTYDRDEHCEIQGSYDLKTKEQSCSKTDHSRGGISVPTNECGIELW